MTKMELINRNKAMYAKQHEKNERLTGLSKKVGETLVLEWIKGNKWMGGLSDSRASQIYKSHFAGFNFDEVFEEFERQIEIMM